MTTLAPVITPGDRLSFTTFLAVMIHAAIILGVTFTYVTSKQSASTMEVTLAQHRSKNRPDRTDFLAQFNQIGSGTLEEKALTTSPTKADFHDTIIRETNPLQHPKTAPKMEIQQKTVVTTTGKNDQPASVDARLKAPIPGDVTDPRKKSLVQRSLEIASLEARLDRQRQIHAKRPRIKLLEAAICLLNAPYRARRATLAAIVLWLVSQRRHRFRVP